MKQPKKKTEKKRSIFEDCLVGDFFPETWLERFSADRNNMWKDLLKDEERLFNLYSHSLMDQARILRTPTTSCTRGWLERTDDQDNIETIINICVNKAKKAREHLEADVLIAGCVGAIFNHLDKNETEVSRELEEIFVYLTDLEVDNLLIQNIGDKKLLRLTLEKARSVSGMPMAVFFENMDFSSQEVFEELEQICLEFSIELCGLKITANENSYDQIHPNFKKMPFGVLLEKTLDKPINWPLLSERFHEDRPLMILGGQNVTRDEWRKFIRTL